MHMRRNTGSPRFVGKTMDYARALRSSAKRNWALGTRLPATSHKASCASRHYPSTNVGSHSLPLTLITPVLLGGLLIPFFQPLPAS